MPPRLTDSKIKKFIKIIEDCDYSRVEAAKRLNLSTGSISSYIVMAKNRKLLTKKQEQKLLSTVRKKINVKKTMAFLNLNSFQSLTEENPLQSFCGQWPAALCPRLICPCLLQIP